MPIDAVSASPSIVKPLAAINSKVETNGKSFENVLSDTLQNVNQLQLEAKQKSFDLATGKIQDVADVVIATEKATVALQLTMQVRNKIVDAYQEIMRMQV